MIEIKELRIGNLLNYKGKNVHITNLSLDIDDEYQDMVGFCYVGKNTDEIFDWNRSFGDDLQPALVTAEILEKAGFEKAADKYGGWLSKEIQREQPRTFSQLRIREDGFGFYYDNTFVTRITYVHQLQNLFHSLAGSELEINL